MTVGTCEGWGFLPLQNKRLGFLKIGLRRGDAGWPQWEKQKQLQMDFLKDHLQVPGKVGQGRNPAVDRFLSSGYSWGAGHGSGAPGSFPDLLDLKVYFDNLSRRSVCTKKLGKDAGRRPLGLLFLASHHIQIYVRKESKIHWRNIRSKLNWNLRPTQLKNLPLGPLVQ